MAVEVNRGPSIYTVKYANENGVVGFKDLPATGTWDAQQRFEKENPNLKVLTIYRKS